MNVLGYEGFNEPEVDALTKETGENDKFAELNDLHGSDEEESKTNKRN